MNKRILTNNTIREKISRRIIKMTRDQLIAAIGEATEMPKKDASKALHAIIEAIQHSLAEGEDVILVGFGSFKVAKRKERHGRNPRTGDPITIAATTVPVFSAGKTLKEAVNS